MFVALVPPAAAIEDLDAFLEPRRGSAPFRWALPEQFHITLSFLAAVAERHLDEGVRLQQVAPAEHGATELQRLATGARAAASRTGIPVDGQRVRAHITLARLGRPAEVSNWVRLLDAYSGPPWTADRIELVASHLGEGPGRRPRYETIAEIPLSRPDSP